MEFGNGMGDLINLQPLHSFYVAATYGLVNAEGLTQVALNVLITVPLGVLLPLLFPERFGRIRWVFLAGLALALATEIAQLVTGRNADIDDVIANSAGVALGTALVIMSRAIVARLRRMSRAARQDLSPGTRRTVAATAVILGVLVPFVAVVAINGGNRLGVVYYGHLRPSAVRIPDSIPSHGSSSKFYRRTSGESPEAVMSRLRDRLAMTRDCAKDEGTWVCSDGGTTRLFVYPHGTWSVDLQYAQGPANETTPPPDEKSGRTAARTHLAAFGIDPDTLEYAGTDDQWKDGRLHLDYTSREHGGDVFLWGKVSVTLGANGKLAAIEDARIPVTAVQTVETISPRAAIGIAQDVGVGVAPGTAVVSTVTASHYFDEDSGYLIPVWRIEGTLSEDGGNAIDWKPAIDARHP
jgi:hypothetical protein